MAHGDGAWAVLLPHTRHRVWGGQPACCGASIATPAAHLTLPPPPTTGGPRIASWEQAIAAFTGGAIPSIHLDKGGKGWRVFSFES